MTTNSRKGQSQRRKHQQQIKTNRSTFCCFLSVFIVLENVSLFVCESVCVRKRKPVRVQAKGLLATSTHVSIKSTGDLTPDRWLTIHRHTHTQTHTGYFQLFWLITSFSAQVKGRTILETDVTSICVQRNASYLSCRSFVSTRQCFAPAKVGKHELLTSQVSRSIKFLK